MMKIKTLILPALIIASFGIIVAGCASVVTPTPHSEEPLILNSTLKPSLTTASKPTLTMPPMPTPRSTLAPDKAQQLLATLQNEECNLPCYLGIVPGQTTLQDASEMLIGLGANDLGEYRRDSEGLSSYTFSFVISDPVSREKLLSHLVFLIIDHDMMQNEVVQVVIASAGTMSSESSSTAIETYRLYWQRYSAHQIFLQLGEPTIISTSKIERSDVRGAELVLLYEQQRIAINIYGTERENNLCPQNGATMLHLNMLLSYPGSTVDIYDAYGGVPLTNQDLYPVIDDVFEVSKKEFYDRVLVDPFVCFSPKAK